MAAPSGAYAATRSLGQTPDESRTHVVNRAQVLRTVLRNLLEESTNASIVVRGGKQRMDAQEIAASEPRERVGEGSSEPADNVRGEVDVGHTREFERPNE